MTAQRAHEELREPRAEGPVEPLPGPFVIGIQGGEVGGEKVESHCLLRRAG
ncbi:MAG: hypothetical protein ACRDL2_16535 [Gaiellaceae bacterium]